MKQLILFMAVMLMASAAQAQNEEYFSHSKESESRIFSAWKTLEETKIFEGDSILLKNDFSIEIVFKRDSLGHVLRDYEGKVKRQKYIFSKDADTLIITRYSEESAYHWGRIIRFDIPSYYKFEGLEFGAEEFLEDLLKSLKDMKVLDGESGRILPPERG